MRKNLAKHSTTLLLSFILASCSSTEPSSEIKPTEVPSKEAVKVDLPQEQLFANAKKFYSSGLWSVAQESFQALKDGYSPGPYTEFAEIKLADCHFEQAEYPVAATAYEEFMKNHPSSASMGYAMLRAGRSYEFANKGTGRDVGSLEKARDHYQALIQQYPDSVYAGAAKQYRFEVLEKLSDYEKSVQKFYEKAYKPQAAQARSVSYQQNIEPALDKSRKEVESVHVAESKSATTSQISEIKPAVISVKRELPVTSKSSPTTLQKPNPETAQKIQPTGQYRIQSVQCSKAGSNKIFIYLNKDFHEPDFLKRYQNVKSENNLLSFQLPSTDSKELKLSCFAEKDLSISSTGAFVMNSNQSFSILSLSNPPRLLVAID